MDRGIKTWISKAEQRTEKQLYTSTANTWQRYKNSQMKREQSCHGAAGNR